MSEELRTVYVGNLAECTTQAHLFELFLQAGPLEQVMIPFDKETKKQKNFAFVRFQHECSVPYAIHLLNDIHLYGQKLRVQNRKSRLPLPPVDQVGVHSLDPEYNSNNDVPVRKRRAEHSNYNHGPQGYYLAPQDMYGNVQQRLYFPNGQGPQVQFYGQNYTGFDGILMNQGYNDIRAYNGDGRYNSYADNTMQNHQQNRTNRRDYDESYNRSSQHRSRDNKPYHREQSYRSRDSRQSNSDRSSNRR